MRRQTYIAVNLLALLATGCGEKVSSVSGSPISGQALLLIELKGGAEVKFPIALAPSSKGVRSFSSNATAGRNLDSSVAYSYAGEVELNDAYSPEDGQKGHLVAFRISQFDPDLRKVVYSTTQYGLFSGAGVTVFDDRGIRVAISHPNSEHDSGGQPATRSDGNDPQDYNH